MKINLDEKIAVVTGGSNGIGRSIALALADSGADVIINYCNDEKSANEVVNIIRGLGRRSVAEKCDVSDSQSVIEMMKKIKNNFGRIDILINNAGLTIDKLLIRMPFEDWQKVIDTNLTGVFNCSKAVAMGMIRQKSGKIINISSISGLAGTPGQTNYSASKGGINSFTKALSKELAPMGICVNAVAPGFIESRMTEKMQEKNKVMGLSLIPMGRFGKQEEVANMVLFLVSDYSNYITGQIISIDGGMYT